MSIKSLNALMITGMLVSTAQSLQAEDLASLYTIHDAYKGALNADFSGSSYSGKEIARIPGSGYDGKYSGHSNNVYIGGNIGIGYNTELVIEAPYAFNSKDIQQFNNGQRDERKESGFTTLTVGTKHRLFISDDGKNEVQIQGYLTSKDAIMKHEEVDLAYLHMFTDTTKVVLGAGYFKNKKGPNVQGIRVSLIESVTPNILFIPHIKVMRINAYETYSTFNSEEASLSIRFNIYEYWHITPEVYIAHSDQRNTDYYANNIGAGTARGIALKIQREF